MSVSRTLQCCFPALCDAVLTRQRRSQASSAWPKQAGQRSTSHPGVITAVTFAELSVGPLVAADRRTRAARQAHVQLAEASFAPLPFDAAAARAFG